MNDNLIKEKELNDNLLLTGDKKVTSTKKQNSQSKDKEFLLN
jgi:hypothetical protein